MAGDRFELTAQPEGDLGRRMADFFESVFQRGADQAVLLGTDSPTLPLSYISSAFEQLEDVDLVLGPATDGGYYLIGLSGSIPSIFQNMNWSRPSVLADTIDRLRGSSYRLGLLPAWYDVDTLDDWQMLRGHLSALRRAGIDPGVPNTEKLALESIW
ncbi:MAG TPA: TIGR04282 family arsenosugar biosynthesis glycosyltransferase [Gemmataceae bacterium]|nr:TIGR04282 family arsenosugar biosynthesis glycosyltransferase [Gemmataceae bacterium]